jgi:hypothetical protein
MRNKEREIEKLKKELAEEKNYSTILLLWLLLTYGLMIYFSFT